MYFIEELAVYLMQTYHFMFQFVLEGVNLWNVSMLALLLSCASCAGCGKKIKSQNQNAANSFLAAIELFIWCQAENGTEAVRNV